MQIILTERFQEDVESLSDQQKDQVFSVILKLPRAMKELHQHSGLGLRKIHSSGVFELRIGLGLRVAFGWQKNAALLHRVGTHDEIQKFLKSL